VTKPSDPPSELARRRRDLVDDASLRGAAFTAAYSDAADAWLAGLVGRLASDAAGVALLAVGAYGRRELCPASDLDLVLVHDGKRGRGLSQLAEGIWYPIWDSGIALDHSVRTLREALSVADQDLKAALGLLDARVVAGDAGLGEVVVARVADQWRDRARRRLPGFAAIVEERHAASGDVAYALEPDLKEGRGGTRDVAALRALAKVTPVYAVDERLEASAGVVLDTRVALQRRAGHTDRLLLDYQDDVSDALGEADADVLMAKLSAAARTVAWQSDEAWRSVHSWVEGPPRRSSAPADVALSPGLVLRDEEVSLRADAVPADDSSLALRAAAAAAYLGVRIARATLRRFQDEIGVVVSPWPDATRDAFVSLLGGGQAAIYQLETLDQHGLFVRYLPEWDSVRSRPQRNAFHRYTVDRHLLETVARASELVREVRRPDLLLVGALLHDLGKGTPGDHTDNGVVLAEAEARRMGFEPADVDVIVALVRHHLLLPAFATGRDLEDPSTIATVAATVGNEDVLELLHALTIADSLATGATAWTPWKASLVERLVDRTRTALRGSAADARVPDPLLDAPARHAIEEFEGELTVEPRPGGVRILAPDALGLLALEVAVFGVHALGVRSARTYTIGDLAIGEFEVESEFDRDVDWDRVADDLRAALTDAAPLRDRLEARARRYPSRPQAARPAEARVLVDNELTAAATIVEIRAADGIGVLYAITSAIAGLDVRVEQAYVSTLGHEVADTFYVTGPEGGKLTDPDVLDDLEAAVLRALGTTGSVQFDDQMR